MGKDLGCPSRDVFLGMHPEATCEHYRYEHDDPDGGQEHWVIYSHEYSGSRGLRMVLGESSLSACDAWQNAIEREGEKNG